MQVLVVILNYRTAHLTIDCLRSLREELATVPAAAAVVVDNASNDGSIQQIESAIAHEGWGSWAWTLKLDHNGGYAAGNNAGIAMAMQRSDPPQYIMILNPDTLVTRGAVTSLVEFMSHHSDAGIVGSELEDPDGSGQGSAHRSPTPLSELDSAARLGMLSRWLRKYSVTPEASPQARACDWVSGAAMMVRREVFETVGLMDEGYFLYFDEVDFCARARAAGWAVWHVPDSKVVHLEGSATGINQSKNRRAKYWYDSRRRFFVKSYGIAGLLCADLFWAIGRLVFTVRQAFLPKLNSDPKWYAWDLLWGDLQALLSGRLFQIQRERMRT